MKQRLYNQKSNTITGRDNNTGDLVFLKDVRDFYSIYDHSIWWYEIPGYPKYQINNHFDQVRYIGNPKKFPYGMIVAPEYISKRGFKRYGLYNPMNRMYEGKYNIEIEYDIKDYFPHYLLHPIKTCCNFDGSCRGPGNCIIKRTKLYEDELTPERRKKMESPIEFIPNYSLWEGET